MAAPLTRFLVYRKVVNRWTFWCRTKGRDRDKAVAFFAPYVGEGNVLVLEREEIESDRRCEFCGHPDTADNPVRGEADECAECSERRAQLYIRNGIL